MKKVVNAMSKGASISWLQALEEVTGRRKLDATPLLEYYKPLVDFLTAANQKDQVNIGWDGPGEPFTA